MLELAKDLKLYPDQKIKVWNILVRSPGQIYKLRTLGLF